MPPVQAPSRACRASSQGATILEHKAQRQDAVTDRPHRYSDADTPINRSGWRYTRLADRSREKTATGPTREITVTDPGLQSPFDHRIARLSQFRGGMSLVDPQRNRSKRWRSHAYLPYGRLPPALRYYGQVTTIRHRAAFTIGHCAGPTRCDVYASRRPENFCLARERRLRRLYW